MQRTLRVLTAKHSCLALLVFIGSEARAETGSPEPQRASRVEVNGARLEFQAFEISRGKRSERDEIGAITRTTARLTTEKPLLVRKDRVPAGTYDLRVERKGEKSYFLVIEGKADGSPLKNGSPPAREKKGSESSADSTSGAGEEALEEKDAQEKHEGGDAPETKEAREPKTPRRKAALPKEKTPREEDRPRAEQLRIPLSIGSCERKGDALSVALQLRSKGTKLRFVLRAGETEARATVRFGETP